MSARCHSCESGIHHACASTDSCGCLHDENYDRFRESLQLHDELAAALGAGDHATGRRCASRLAAIWSEPTRKHIATFERMRASIATPPIPAPMTGKAATDTIHPMLQLVRSK